jgi:uncharacterized phage protein (TIGR02218 family)
MTYATKDRSVSDGAPIECYQFVAPFRTWRYTSHSEPITVAGNVYTPLPIVRTAIDTNSIIDTLTTMDFIIPSMDSLAFAFCFAQSPKELIVTVYRVHEGDDYSTDYKVEWTGTLSNASANGDLAVLSTASLFQTELNSNMSAVFYQRSCNHILYDARCKVVKATYTASAVVTKIQDQIITVDDMVYALDELISGEMLNTRTNEVQGIISNALNVIRVGYKFFDIVVGDTVELSLGCDHSRLGHCKTRFNNVVNYGGFDFIPSKDVFGALNYTTLIDTIGKVRDAQVSDTTKSNHLPLGGN